MIAITPMALKIVTGSLPVQNPQMVSAAIAAGDVQAINYFVANKYVEAFKELATSRNQKTLILPMEATSLLGALSGIGEIAKEAFGEDAKTNRTASRIPDTGPSNGGNA